MSDASPSFDAPQALVNITAPVAPDTTTTTVSTADEVIRAARAHANGDVVQGGKVDTQELERHVQNLQEEISGLEAEVAVLRKRDDTLNFYMQRLDEEMRLAARLQHDFLPKSLPQVGRVTFHTVFRPAGYVSGDLYDVMRLDETHVGFYIADAVGHGMPAALLTMFIKNALVTKHIAPEGYRLLPPGETVARLNDALVSQHLSYATFATALYGRIDTETFEVCFARGGHPSPVLLRHSGEVVSLEVEGSLLGIFENEKFDELKVCLEPGDRMFIFTDGVEVAFGAGAALDAAQWREAIRSRAHLSTEALLADLCGQIDSGEGSLAPKDDLTIIVMEVC